MTTTFSYMAVVIMLMVFTAAGFTVAMTMLFVMMTMLSAAAMTFVTVCFFHI